MRLYQARAITSVIIGDEFPKNYSCACSDLTQEPCSAPVSGINAESHSSASEKPLLRCCSQRSVEMEGAQNALDAAVHVSKKRKLLAKVALDEYKASKERDREDLLPKAPTRIAPVTVQELCECSSVVPCFGWPETKIAWWCKKCKPPDAVNVISTRCKCGRVQPSLGIPVGKGGDGRAQWCLQCPDLPKGAVNVINKRCPCGSSKPNFGFPGQKATWCSKCPDRPPEAVNVYKERRGATKCECGRAQPNFGPEGGNYKDAKWCAGCRPSDAVDLVTKRCECGKSKPSFGIMPGDAVVQETKTRLRRAQWCSKCPGRPKEAVHLRTAVNKARKAK